MAFLKDYLDFFIFGTLGMMSFFLVWYVIERYMYFSSVDVAEFKSHNKLNVALTHRLTAISIIGVNAPYVGLLGTVIGILITFWDIGQGGKIEPGAIMLGLALALKATAAGLAVAIPAVMFYNALLRKVDVLISDWRDIQQFG